MFSATSVDEQSWMQAAVKRMMSLCRQQPVEIAARMQRIEIVAAADMMRADKDLRKCEAAGPLDHLVPLVRRAGRVDLPELHALLPQQPLGGGTIAAELARVDDHVRHPKSRRKPVLRQPYRRSHAIRQKRGSTRHSRESQDIDGGRTGAQKRAARGLGGCAGGV